MIEVWKDIPTLEGRYQVSTLGNVRSNARVLSTNANKGPKIVSIVIDGNIKVFEVRHLMAYTFLGADINSRSKPKLIHIDGNFKNIQLDNLKLADYSDLDNEEWKDIEGFENIYQVSNKGRIKRLAHIDTYTRRDTGKVCHRNVGEKILKPNYSKSNGYYDVNLCFQGLNKYYDIHRLVAKAFIPNPDNLPQVNHIDGDKHNNCVENLEWCTAKYNIEHSVISGARKPIPRGVYRCPVSLYCVNNGKTYSSIKAAASDLNLSYYSLSDSLQYRRSCNGYEFIRLED